MRRGDFLQSREPVPWCGLGEFLWFRAILSFSRSQLASVPLSRALLMFQDKYQIQTTMRPPLYFVGN